ncbi:MAG: tetratricopeptide repeat protein [Steroidobacteraceae bacterium]
MKNIRAILTVVGMNLAVFNAAALLPVVQAIAAEEQKVSAKVGKPLQEALAAGQAKQWDQALTKLREADAVGEKSAYDQFKINQIYAWLYTSQKKYGEAAAVYEKLLDSGFISSAESDQYIKQIAQMYLQTKNNTKAMEYLQRWLKGHPGDNDMTAVLGQLQYQSGQTKQALDTFAGLVNSAEKAGQKPKEDWLKLMYRISYQASGSSTVLDKTTLGIVDKLLRYYPNETYWTAMLAGLRGQQGSDAYQFQVDRLRVAVGILKEPNEFVEMAQLARSLGYAGEALSVMEAGYAKGILGSGPGKEREDRLRDSVKKLADADVAALPSLDKKARAAASGQDDAILGETYMGIGQYPQAIEALERGLKKGGIKNPDQAQIALGIAYLRSNQVDKARTAFKAVDGDSDLGRIARLWLLHAASK